ncbi:LysR substrate-binding domain-containing protein [Streptomyces sp. NPDC051362]|uniref:LysR substrate-binding domain-containing protein n=1 Tax=Streptomyces sp. NPDC051362 TaxID=3365651 RepID=UPI0037B3F15D
MRLPRLADEDWVSGSRRSEGTLLDAALRHGFRPHTAHVVAEWTARQGYVAAGLGVTPVPALAAEAVRPGIALVPVRDEAAPARAGVRGDPARAVPDTGRHGVPGRAADLGGRVLPVSDSTVGRPARFGHIGPAPWRPSHASRDTRRRPAAPPRDGRPELP